MIKDVTGDILLTRAELLAHGIAPNDPFDSGLALALRERWPSLVRDYRHDTRSRAIAAGEIWNWTGVHEAGGTRHITNLVTQDSLGQGPSAKPGKATLENVRHALQNLARHLQKERISSAALPRLATGVGGLDWRDVRPLIEQYLGGLDTTVLLYSVYQRDLQADEKL